MSAQVQVGGGGAQSSPPAGPSNGAGRSNSLLTQLRARAKAQQAEHSVELPVGGEFGTWLKIKYKVLDEGPLDDFIARRQASPDKSPRVTSLNMDLMAQSCMNVVGYDENGGGSWVLEDDDGPVRLEHRLAVLLDLPLLPTTAEHPQQIEYNAHEVIMLLFGKNPMAVVSHGDDLATWMQDPKKAPDAGKS